MVSFIEKLEKPWSDKKFVCVNLDPDFDKLPSVVTHESTVEEAIFRFNKEIIDATHDLVCAYKPNSAFYEAYGEAGLRALKRTAQYLNTTYDDVATILDAKRADIGNTNKMYAEAVFDELGFDAITIHPYLGREAVQPFLDRKEKGVIVLVRTSNKGGGEFQDLNVNGEKLYEHVARNVAEEWNKNGNCGVVVGATHPEELTHVRNIIDAMPILIPGVGAQGGSAHEAFSRGKNKNEAGVIISVGRSVIYASRNDDFQDAARKEVEKLSKEITTA